MLNSIFVYFPYLENFSCACIPQLIQMLFIIILGSWVYGSFIQKYFLYFMCVLKTFKKITLLVHRRKQLGKLTVFLLFMTLFFPKVLLTAFRFYSCNRLAYANMLTLRDDVYEIIEVSGDWKDRLQNWELKLCEVWDRWFVLCSVNNSNFVLGFTLPLPRPKKKTF